MTNITNTTDTADTTDITEINKNFDLLDQKIKETDSSIDSIRRDLSDKPDDVFPILKELDADFDDLQKSFDSQLDSTIVEFQRESSNND